MHIDWLQQAVDNAPNTIDDNMTIKEFVNKYSCLKQLVDCAMKLGDIITKPNKQE
jgi:hypothetical protein